MIAALAGQGLDVRQACLTLGVSRGGYYAWKGRPTSPTGLRRIWLANAIIAIPKAARGTYGQPRVTAELRFGRGVTVGHNTVSAIMQELGIKGIPNRRPPKGSRLHQVTSLDLVKRNFRRAAPNQLWLTDITEQPTLRGQGLLLRSPRCLLEAGRGLVNRHDPDFSAGDECTRNGYQDPPPERGTRDPFRSRGSIHVLGLQREGQGGRPCFLYGL